MLRVGLPIILPIIGYVATLVSDATLADVLLAGMVLAVSVPGGDGAVPGRKA